MMSVTHKAHANKTTYSLESSKPEQDIDTCITIVYTSRVEHEKMPNQIRVFSKEVKILQIKGEIVTSNLYIDVV